MDCVVAGGVEDMTHCFLPYPEEYKNEWLRDNVEGVYMSMGETAERVADQYDISRTMMDQMAVDSHARAISAQRGGKLTGSIIPVTNNRGDIITEDDGIRPETTLESIAGLKTPFRPDNGRVTAATSSQMTDAAAFVVVMSSHMADELGLQPIARFIGFQVAGCDATLMGLGPVYAVPKIMKKTGLQISDMDVFELNEAFASQALACIRELGLPPEKVNPYGGAMSLGHPMGATGAFLTIKALDYLRDTTKRYGLVTMCIGGGMGAAAIFERL